MKFPANSCLLMFLILSTAIHVDAAERPAAGEQSAQTSTTVSELVHNYLLYLPKDYSESKTYPLLLFLHGAGERGNDLDKVKVHGPPKLIAAGKEFPFIVVSPQCAEDGWWNTLTIGQLLDHIESNYRVDKKRIYVTGLSMGGYGTWELALRQPERFAAIAPICGGGNDVSARFGKPIQAAVWAFHGAKDGVVPLKKSEEMVDALKSRNVDVKLTVYPEANHDSWTETYNNDELYEWFLQHKKP